MRASECSFDDLMEIGHGSPTLSVLLSYVQVEHGLKDLQASWEGFTDSSDYGGEKFSNKYEICLNFGNSLLELIVDEPILI